MEEIINKPDNQFKDILNDLIDYQKESEEKSALIKEVCHTRHPTKPAASLNSSIYSSAASSSSSTSSTSDSSTNSASSSSTLSSPSQSTQSNSDATNSRASMMHGGNELDNIEVAKMEDLGKTARILEHRLAISNELKTATNGAGYVASSSAHSDKRSISLNGKLPIPSSSSTLSHVAVNQSMQQHSNLAHQASTNSALDTNITNWITISKRDKRKRRTAEQPVLSQHIPGHRGEQEVDLLVNFIESKQSGANNMNNSLNKKVTKNTKTQPKRQSTQIMENDREINQRKPNNKSTTTQVRPLVQQQQQHQSKLTSNPTTTAVFSTQPLHSNQRKVQAISIDNQPLQSTKQQSLQERSNDRSDECKETTPNDRMKSKRNHDLKKDLTKDEAVVTFADHIRISDDDVGDQFTFGFFDEQRQQTISNQTKPTKTTTTTVAIATKHNENSPDSNSKSNHIGQKHKLKHPKASLNSEQKRYKFNDNIDANSFNYHQILEFIRSSWETTRKSHRL